MVMALPVKCVAHRWVTLPMVGHDPRTCEDPPACPH